MSNKFIYKQYIILYKFYVVATCPSQSTTIPTNSATTNPSYWTTTSSKYEFCKYTANYSESVASTTDINNSKNYSTAIRSKTSNMVTAVSGKLILNNLIIVTFY